MFKGVWRRLGGGGGSDLLPVGGKFPGGKVCPDPCYFVGSKSIAVFGSGLGSLSSNSTEIMDKSETLFSNIGNVLYRTYKIKYS